MTVVKLPWPSAILKPNGGGKFGRGAIFARSRVANKAKADAYALAYSAGRPDLPDSGPIRVTWTLCPPDKRGRDIDNAVASLKWHQDGVAMAWGVDDRRFEPTYRWGEFERGGAVVLTIGEPDDQTV